jgi:hypothetical protein
MSTVKDDDVYTIKGANRLVKIIKAYWQKRGHAVDVERFAIVGWKDHWGVRSDLVNGLPAND